MISTKETREYKTDAIKKRGSGRGKACVIMQDGVRVYNIGMMCSSVQKKVMNYNGPLE